MGVTLVVSGDAPGTVRACDSIVLKQLNTEIAAQRALKPAADAYFGLELRVLRGKCVRTKARERGRTDRQNNPWGTLQQQAQNKTLSCCCSLNCCRLNRNN